MNKRRLYSSLGCAAALLSPLGVSAAVAAAPSPSVLYVSTQGSDQNGSGTPAAPYATIQQAVQVAPPGATIIVEPGTYHGMVVIDKPLTLESDPTLSGAATTTVIDASGAPNGILLKGEKASGTTIRNLTVEHADQAGILALGPMSGLDIVGNQVVANDQGFVANDAKAPMDGHCSALPGGDCEALHLMSVTNSLIVGNTVANNLDGGIYLTDEFGPNAFNTVADNISLNNQVDCGITLASHNPKGAANPHAGGVYDNVVIDNQSNGNGAAGVVLATPLPGGAVYGNIVTGNTFSGNQQGGVVFHTHSPGAKVADDLVIDNQISDNGADPDPGLQQPVGISIAGMGSPITGLVVAHNQISSEYYGIAVANAPDLTLTDNQADSTVTLPVWSAPTAPSTPGPSQSSGSAIVFRLAHRPVGYWGPQVVPLQRAADVVWNLPSPPTLFDLAHHPVGYYGPSWIAAQQAAAVLWRAGIHSRQQTGPIPLS
ncbi:MAG: right-handed parallel beta-helix repeat-containing protein [Firmicutes bacterium]|nr:right-handed parallel beta-helix repeat-containing protein [Bacillota bacterium]